MVMVGSRIQAREGEKESELGVVVRGLAETSRLLPRLCQAHLAREELDVIFRDL